MNNQRLGLLQYVFMVTFAAACAFALDGYVDLDYCEYDSCRYLRYSLADAGLDDGFVLFGSGTQAMHWLYGETGFSLGFLYAAFVNLFIFSVPLIFFRVRHDFVFFPLAFCFIVLPGKEFFLIAALIYLFSAKLGASPGEWVLRVAFSLIFILTARPAFVLIFLLAWYIWRQVGVASAPKIFLYCLVLSVLVGVGMSYLSPPDPDHSALQQDSTIEAIALVRNLTFGFDAFGVWSRALIYFLYMIFLPVLEVYRLFADLSAGVNSPSQFYAVFSIVAFSMVLVKVGFPKYWRMCLISSFVIAATYPFLHTRYLLPVAVLLYFCYQRYRADSAHS
jgi:hypothetical protein